MKILPDWFERDNYDISREYAQICTGVDDGKHTTDYYVSEHDRNGASIVIVGGMHGGEPAGAEAASRFVNAVPSCGKLSVIPRANPIGLQQRQRDSPGHGDLNDLFTGGPDDAHAAAIWEAVDAARPDVVIDLHTSRWPRSMSNKNASNGQAIYPSEESRDVADHVARQVSNERVKHGANHLASAWQDSRKQFFFDVGNTMGEKPDGPLVDYARYQLGEDTQSFLVEVARNGVPYETRVDWHCAVVRGIADEFGVAIHGV